MQRCRTGWSQFQSPHVSRLLGMHCTRGRGGHETASRARLTDGCGSRQAGTLLDLVRLHRQHRV